jgi:DNA-binding CsgD family transcriptional regulator
MPSKSARIPASPIQAAASAYLAGRETESLELLTRAHQAAVERGDRPEAARAAFWAAFQLMNTGDHAQASGWIARARRLLEEHGESCVECGYVLLPLALAALGSGDLARAETTFGEAEATGLRFRDLDLVALARHGRGRAFIAGNRIAEGVSLLDEVMLSVTAGELTPIVAGTVYCSVISACFDLYDVGRAREWTSALNAWCDAQRTVPYRGDCLVYRSEVLRLAGRWQDAFGEATQATSAPLMRQAVKAAALYELGEIHRLRGEAAAAEAAYRGCAELGRPPHPGLALLRLTQGDADAARASISRALAEHRGRQRFALLAAAVEIHVAAAEMAAAHAASTELAQAAERIGSPWLKAMDLRADGLLLLADRQPEPALARLQDALAFFNELGMPYEGARTRIAIAAACDAVGDAEGGRLEREAAVRAFREIGAVADLAALERPAAPLQSDGLSAREIEVLRLIARGHTNRAIADALSISEKTVARHISNIFNKLDLTSRAAATAYAFRKGLAE